MLLILPCRFFGFSAHMFGAREDQLTGTELWSHEGVLLENDDYVQEGFTVSLAASTAHAHKPILPPIPSMALPEQQEGRDQSRPARLGSAKGLSGAGHHVTALPPALRPRRVTRHTGQGCAAVQPPCAARKTASLSAAQAPPRRPGPAVTAAARAAAARHM
jgi:hypothetical protein